MSAVKCRLSQDQQLIQRLVCRFVLTHSKLIFAFVALTTTAYRAKPTAEHTYTKWIFVYVCVCV